MKNRNQYPNEWQDVIRPAILKRDKYRCVRCGLRHKQWYQNDRMSAGLEVDAFDRSFLSSLGYSFTRIILQVDHIDNNKSNNEPENLRSLCPSCHLKANNYLRTRKPKVDILAPSPPFDKEIFLANLEKQVAKMERDLISAQILLKQRSDIPLL